LNRTGLSSPFFVFLEKVFQQELPQDLCFFPINSTPAESGEAFISVTKLQNWPVGPHFQ